MKSEEPDPQQLQEAGQRPDLNANISFVKDGHPVIEEDKPTICVTSAEEDDEVAEGRTNQNQTKHWIQFLILISILLTIIFASRYIGRGLRSIRDELAKIPFGAGVTGVIVIQSLRKLIPPLYFFFPVGTVSGMYFGDKKGEELGALYLQLIDLMDIVHFYIIRRFYSNAFNKYLEGAGGTVLDRYLPSELRQALRVFDVGWREWIVDRPLYRQGPTMGAMFLAYYMDDLVTLIWMATRSEVRWEVFSVVWAFAAMANWPRKVLSLSGYLATADGLEDGNSFLDIVERIASIAWYQVLCIVLLTGTSTLFVHSRNMYLVVTEICRRTGCIKEGSEDGTNCDVTDNAVDREITVLPATQADNSEGTAVVANRSNHS